MHPGSPQPHQVFAAIAVSAAAVALAGPSVHWPSASPSLAAAAYLRAPAASAAPAGPAAEPPDSYRPRLRFPAPAGAVPSPRVSDDVESAAVILPPKPAPVQKAAAPVPSASSAPAAAPYPSYSATPLPPAQSTAYGSPEAYAESLVGSAQFACLQPLWDRESGWNASAENPSSGAYGIPQALPGSKMASAGPDWATDPDVQVRWGVSYIDSVYGSPCGAWAHEEEYSWY